MTSPSRSTTVLSSQLQGRLDAKFHLISQAHQARTALLREALTDEQAKQTLAAVPPALLRAACVDIVPGDGGRATEEKLLKTAQAYPHLALALVEAASPAFIRALWEDEARSYQERQAQLTWNRNLLGAAPGAMPTVLDGLGEVAGPMPAAALQSQQARSARKPTP